MTVTIMLFIFHSFTIKVALCFTFLMVLASERESSLKVHFALGVIYISKMIITLYEYESKPPYGLTACKIANT